MRFRQVLGAGALLTGVLAVANAPSVSAAGSGAGAAGGGRYVVLADEGAALGSVEAAVVAAGGTVTGRNEAVGMLTVTASGDGFAARVGGVAGVVGVAADRSIGKAPRRADDAQADVDAARAEARAAREAERPRGDKAAEPLAGLQWDMKMIGATPTGSYAVERGEKKVTVGVIDTGIDGTHPDIRPNFSYKLSRNFVTDRADLGDGDVCEYASCVDPVDRDDDGHGTHVAGTIGAAVNGFGMAGVAPDVTLVNIRAGQDSGYFLLDSTVNALTYAGDAGIDVVNMSFYVDPWLFNCPDNPVDASADQAEQRTIITAMQRALRYARGKGVTLVAALGNSHFNYDDITSIVDQSSPDFPFQTPYPRPVRANCLDLPAMGDGVIGTIALGPSGKKADYSNWGVTYGEVSAPGGFFRDFIGTPQNRTPGNLILAPFPKNVGIDQGVIDPVTGESLDPDFVLRECGKAGCAYYQYLQGTSMAAPHTAGVAALIVSKYGESRRGGFGLDPDKVARILFRTATDTPCPAGGVVDYTAEGRPASYRATCVGTAERNNIYGHGIVNALAAVSGHDDHDDHDDHD